MGNVGYVDKEGKHRYFYGRNNQLPAHDVTLDSYSMGKFEVTYREFDLFCKATGRELIAMKYRKKGRAVQPPIAADFMDWNQAKAYCKWLSDITNLPFSLPTEAQWEYAARSRGKAVEFATDNGKVEYGRNYISEKHNMNTPPPVGKYPPNPLGIYNMSDNVAEWLLDGWYSYTEEPQVNPVGKPRSIVAVRGLRGIGTPKSLYTRRSQKPTRIGAATGMRVVLNQKEPLDVDAALKKLGISPITSKEKKEMLPMNWTYKFIEL